MSENKLKNKLVSAKGETEKYISLKNKKVIKKLKVKQELGQFYTTNYKYILSNLEVPKNIMGFSIKNIIEPFAGNCDLLNFINNKNQYTIELYDIDPKNSNIIKRNTLLNPPNYTNKFIITNPPYLAKNKNPDKTIYNLYKQNDLYKCFLQNLIDNKCIGGIIIVPLNFWCSIRRQDIKLRKQFLEIYKIIIINIFEEKVFDDTSYTICSFQFQLKNLNNLENKKNNLENNLENKIEVHIYPNNKIKTENVDLFEDKSEKYIFPIPLIININLSKKNNYTFGGKIYNLPLKKEYKIFRLTKNNLNKKNTNLLIKCIDDNANNKICLKYVSDDKIFIDNTKNLTARSYATLIIEPEIDIEEQKILVNRFNNFLNLYRKKYNSLFLTNYRESSDIPRKRISFKLIYNIVEYLLENPEVNI